MEIKTYRRYLLKNIKNIFPTNLPGMLMVVLFLAGLYLFSTVSYVLFHSLAELFSIIISIGIFMIAWNARRFFDNHYLLFISISYFFIASIDIMHTIAYRGVEVLAFFDPTADLATQLWIAARYLQAVSLLVAPVFLQRKIKIKLVFGAFAAIVAGIFMSIFYFDVFPVTYIEEEGLTLFKRASEYVISLILAGSILFLVRKKKFLSSYILVPVAISIFFTIISELAFTTYLGVYDFSNMLGHYFKIAAFYLMYRVIIETSLKNPFAYIFRNLEKTTEALKFTSTTLSERNKELENTVENLKIFQKAIDNAFSHIVITDDKGYVIYNNKAAEKTTGFSKEEMAGKKPSLWGKQMPPAFYKNLWKTVKRDKQTFTGELVNKRKDGKLYEAEIVVSPILDEDGKAKFFVGLERDITKEKEIDKAKTEFISLAAHQLRTPLATISLTSEMLRRGIAGEIPEESKEYLDTISAEIKEMAELIEIFLNVSRIEMGGISLNPEQLNLIETMDKTIGEILPQIKKKKITLKKNCGKNIPLVTADRKVVSVILENLFSNSLKYTSEGGRIAVKIKNIEKEVIIEVSDNGVGIPESDQPKIFARLFRAENVSQIRSGGSGLGLYLAKKLAEQAGYKIWFESEENKGSTFFVSIPKLQTGK